MFIQTGESEKKKLIVVSVSQQSVASLAAKYKLSMEQTFLRLTGFMKDLGEETNFVLSFNTEK